MICDRPFKIRISTNGKVKNIVSMYYKTIGNIPIFSCNDLGSYRLLEINDDENIIMIGSDILSKLNDINIEVLAWLLIIRHYTGLSKSECSTKDMIYIDSIVVNIFGVSALTNTLGHLVNILELNKKQVELIEYRINYLENVLLNNFKGKNIDVNEILNRVKITRILGVN